MKTIPFSEKSIVLRTDYSDESAWVSICQAIQQYYSDVQAAVDFVSDRTYDGITREQAIQLLEGGDGEASRYFFFVVDKTSLTNLENPVMAIDLVDEPGRSFRVTPAMMWSVDANLSIANIDFSEFADAADSGGIFRGFPD